MTSHARLQDAHQPMLGIQRISFPTADLPEGDWAAIWREVIGRNVVRLDLEPRSKRPLRSGVSIYALSGMAMMRGEISDHRIARSRGGNARAPVGKSQNGFEKVRKFSRNGAGHGDLFIRTLSAGCRS